MKKTISKLYSYKPLKNYTGLMGSIPVKNKDVFVGVEIELENVFNGYKLGTYQKVTDNSLKINGAELVTVPIKMKYLEVELRRLFGGLNSDTLVTKRCSVHVHMNVRDMTPNQVLNLVMLYMIFERSLYRVSGDRWNSNFCVPLAQAYNLVNELFKNWDHVLSWFWEKYTGLNLCPIYGGESHCIGTVEFRQLHGTTSVEEIMMWCNMITALKRAAQDIPQEEILDIIKTIDSVDEYRLLARRIFGSYAKFLTTQSTFAEDCEWCKTNLKFMIPEKHFQDTIPKMENPTVLELWSLGNYADTINSMPAITKVSFTN